MNTIPIILVVLAAVAIAAWVLRDRVRRHPIPDILKPGNALPQFAALDEDGNRVQSQSLNGSAAVLLFVRGSWCPFCSKQVANLTRHYKEITDSGARLILVTPRPLGTTRRVADFFEVKFEFWLDESLAIAERLQLLHKGGVPNDNRSEYGVDTVWPTSLIVDKEGVIRYTELSRFIADRPNPEKLLSIVKKL